MEKQDSAEAARLSAAASQEPPRNEQNSSVSSERNSRTKEVQDKIESCLHLFMNKEDVVKILFELDGIDPGVTSLAWNQLEEEKPEIFKDFYAKLILEEPSSTSNQLLEQQKDLENFLACLDDPLAFFEEDFQHIPGTSWSPYKHKHMQFPCNFQFLSHAPEVRVLSFFLQLTFYPGETPFR